MRTAIFLALRDLQADRRATLCYALAFAAMLTPLLTLLALKNGVVERMTAELLANPATLQVLPVGAGTYDAEFFAVMGEDRDVAFVVPRTRTISARFLGASHGAARKSLKGPALVPTAQGDPLLGEARVPDLATRTVVLSHEAARLLEADTGAEITGWIERTRDGRGERAEVTLNVIAVLAEAKTGRVSLFVPVDLMVAVENFLDGYGDAGPDWIATALNTPRETFASFRLYARSIDAVNGLRDRIVGLGHQVRSRSDEIATVQQVDNALTWLFWVIAVVAGGGFWLSLTASLRANVERQRAVISMFRLLGADGATRLLFPVAQATIIIAAGAVLTVIACLAVALIIGFQAEALLGDGPVMRLGPGAIAITACLLFGGAALSALAASFAAVRIEAHEVMHHV